MSKIGWQHGTTYGYNAKKCRCAECCEAHTVAQHRWRQKKKPSDAKEHGTFNTYTNYNCRCDACMKAMQEYGRRYRNA